MIEWISAFLDFVLIVVMGFGIAQAIRLIRQLRDLRASRIEMERFVRDFNSAVIRAEAGIKALRSAARESGDDLEKLVEKGVMVRDELNFIVESADSVAERLSVAASGVLRADQTAQAKTQEARQPPTPTKESAPSRPVIATKNEKHPVSRAEEELMQALKKLS